MKLGHVNVDKMLHEITARQFFEWEAYARLEPFSELRQDYRVASILQMLANVNRSGQRAYKLEDFLLRFGEDAAPPVEKPKSGEEMERVLSLIMGVPLQEN